MENKIEYAYIMDPVESPFRQAWDLFTGILIIYIAIQLPLVLAFEPDVPVGMYVWDTIMDIIFILDIGLSFLTGYIKDGIIEKHPYKVAVNYLTGWFVIDFLSAFPFDACLLGPKVYDPQYQVTRRGSGDDILRLVKLCKALRLLRLFRVARLSRILGRLRDRFQLKNSHVTFTGFIFVVALVAHWIGCFWFLVAQLEGIERDTWVSSMIMPGEQLEGGLLDADPSTQYCMCLFHAIMVMATIGSHILPVTNGEHLYSICSMLVGASLFAYGLTNMGGLLFNLNKNDMAYRQRMDEVNDFMQVRGIPRGLQTKVREYYAHLHAKRRFFDADEILAGLTRSLRGEILVAMHESMVLKNDFFKQMDPIFVGEVIQRLKMHSYMPGEVIVREGTTGADMFFIYDGAVEITVQDAASGQRKHIAELGTGGFVGEIALLDPDAIRTATVTATTFSDIYSLSKDDIDQVLELYPQQKGRWLEVSLKRKKDLDMKKKSPVVPAGPVGPAVDRHTPLPKTKILPMTAPKRGDGGRVSMFQGNTPRDLL